jgi:hypothetical protein
MPKWVKGQCGGGHRPTTYNRRTADQIIHNVSGGSSLHAACDEVKIPRTTALRWVTDNRDGFGERYERACEARCEAWADDLVVMADKSLKLDSMARVQGHKVAIDTRRWIMGRRLPSRWGEKIEVAQRSTNVHLFIPHNDRVYDPKVLEGGHVQLIDGTAELVEQDDPA